MILLLKEKQIKLFHILKYYSQNKSFNILNEISNKSKEFISSNRFSRFQSTIEARNKRFVVVCENLNQAGNFAAIVRTCDGLGIQNLCLISEGKNNTSTDTTKATEKLSKLKVDSNFEKHDRVSLGSDKWLTIDKYKSTSECINALKTQGYKIWVSDLSATSFQFDQLIFQPNKITPQLNHLLNQSITNLNNLNDNQNNHEINSLILNDLYNNNNCNNGNSNEDNFIRNDEKIALIFGNEKVGISELMRSLSDRRYYLFMSGLVQSYNISVSVAMTLSFLKQQGVLVGDLSPLEKQQLLNKFILSSIPKNNQFLNRLGYDHNLISKLIKKKI